jgi:hypothetical protein
MAKLDHKHIVRLIGVCEGEPFMLVMELAPLGPFNKYLMDFGQHMTDDDIIQLMLQVKDTKYVKKVFFIPFKLKILLLFDFRLISKN